MRKRAPRKILVECIGCGKPPPSKYNLALRRLWQTRVIILAGEPMVESSCPRCFAVHGWGDDLWLATATRDELCGERR